MEVIFLKIKETFTLGGQSFNSGWTPRTFMHWRGRLRLWQILLTKIPPCGDIRGAQAIFYVCLKWIMIKFLSHNSQIKLNIARPENRTFKHLWDKVLPMKTDIFLDKHGNILLKEYRNYPRLQNVYVHICDE